MDGPEAFVGRERETAALRHAAASARAGDGRIILVSGPPGMGKSALVTYALAAEPDVLTARCLAGEGAPPSGRGGDC